MPTKAPQQADIDSRLESLLAQAGARDRTAIEKHIAICDSEADPQHASLWRRLIVKLGDLATMPMHAAGPHTVQFFIADGKYRMLVFVLEDSQDGLLAVYLPNVLAKAVSEKLLVKNGDRYAPASASSQVLTIEQMDANNPTNPPEHVKHMTGWNRKAVKMTLHVSDPQSHRVNIVERLCVLAARQWAPAPART
jgi:hypothetical protein